MKKYTYYFEYLDKHGDKMFGSIALVAVNMIVANKCFERLYVNHEEDGCRKAMAFNPVATINGIEINVTNVVETTTIN